jgi:hypothetical protein
MMPLPGRLFRAHHTAQSPVGPSEKTGGYRWDDYRRQPRFHVLYTADSAVGALIEKLQRYAGSDEEAWAILAAQADVEDRVPPPQRNTVPVSVVRETAVSRLRVGDPDVVVVDPCDLATLHEIFNLAESHGVQDFCAAGESKRCPRPGDLLGSDHGLARRASVVVFESNPMISDGTSVVAGLVSRSSLDNPASNDVHLNYNLYRETPENGSAPRIYLDREYTETVVPGFRSELETALAHLSAAPECSLDDPRLSRYY